MRPTENKMGMDINESDATSVDLSVSDWILIEQISMFIYKDCAKARQ